MSGTIANLSHEVEQLQSELSGVKNIVQKRSMSIISSHARISFGLVKRTVARGIVP